MWALDVHRAFVIEDVCVLETNDIQVPVEPVLEILEIVCLGEQDDFCEILLLYHTNQFIISQIWSYSRKLHFKPSFPIFPDMKRDPRFIPPERKTRRDKLNRYWPNVAYLGAGVVGLAECTAQVNKDSARKKRIIDALRDLRVKITKDKVFLKVPNVRFYDFYLNLRYIDDLNDSNKWDGNESNVGPLVLTSQS